MLSFAGLLSSLLLPGPALAQSANQPPPLLSDLVDVSPDFRDFRNSYYLADSLAGFDPASGQGSLTWQRHQLYPRTAFDNTEAVLRPFDGVVFPDKEYATNPALPFEIQLVSPRTVRLRLRTGPRARPEGGVADARPRARPRPVLGVTPGSTADTATPAPPGSVTILEKPWHVEFRDAAGRLLTRTQHTSDYAATLVPALPFSFVRRSSDYSRSVAAVFSLVAGREALRQRRVVHPPRQARPEGRAVDQRRQRRADRAHVQADPVLPEQPGLRHVRAHLGAGHLRLRRVAITGRTRCCSATTSWTSSSSSARRRRSSTSTRRSPARRRCRRCGRSASG